MTDGTWGRWAIEVKTGAVREGDLKGLLAFARRQPAYTPLLVADDRARRTADVLGIAWTTWQGFLLDGPPGEAWAEWGAWCRAAGAGAISPVPSGGTCLREDAVRSPRPQMPGGGSRVRTGLAARRAADL